MRLVRYQPVFRPLAAAPSRRAATGSAPAPAWTPAVDVIEEAQQYLLRVDLPGLDENQVAVKLEDGLLTVSGERQAAHGEGAKLLRRERAAGSFSRSFRLPEAVNADGIEARYDRGVLEIRVPRVDRSRQIPIQ